MQQKTTNILTALFSAFLLIAVSTFCKPCHGLMAMPCEHSTGIARIVLAVLLLSGAAAALVKKRWVQTAAVLLQLAGSILLLLTPAFGGCQVASMACHTRTFPLLRIGGLLLIAVHIIRIAVVIIQNTARRDLHAHTK